MTIGALHGVNCVGGHDVRDAVSYLEVEMDGGWDGGWLS